MNQIVSEKRQREDNFFRRIWDFLKADTWSSWFVSLVLLVILIKFIFFPTLSFTTGSALPLVVVESCSMYHEAKFEEWWDRNAAWYEPKNITQEKFQDFPMRNGFSKGDIIFVWGRSDEKVGDIIIFEPGSESSAQHPIIHRIIKLNPIGTKGDHNSVQLTKFNNAQKIDETSIPKDNVIGKAVFRIPALGWVKLIFFEYRNPPEQRGFCS